MLKITTFNEDHTIRFVVEGRLAAAWISVLESCWSEALELPHAPSIHVELSDVTYLDDAGKKLLLKMAESGANLTARDIQMNAIIDEICKGL